MSCGGGSFGGCGGSSEMRIPISYGGCGRKVPASNNDIRRAFENVRRRGW